MILFITFLNLRKKIHVLQVKNFKYIEVNNIYENNANVNMSTQHIISV